MVKRELINFSPKYGESTAKACLFAELVLMAMPDNAEH
jgi:hypothetical protein